MKDIAGNALAADFVWSFTTEATPGSNCPCSIWDDATIPAIPEVNDPSAIEVGVKFRSSVAGYITGLRFYKGALNTGTHIGNLWSSTGQPLASATFTNETSAGWQTVSFATPVAIATDTTYVASYHTDVGFYSADLGYFASTGYANSPLRALGSGVDGPNGVYVYGPSAFPANSGNGNNYWVDVVFAVDVTLPTVTITSPQEGERVVGTIPLAANATDNVGVSSVQFQINGVDLGAPVTATPYTVDWDTTTVANGAYQLTAIVADAAGNTATSAVVNVTVDNPGPPGSYPSTIVLDNFDRVDGGLGLNWGGATGGYSIVSNSVDVGAGNAILWNQTAFGVEQEVFVTLTNVDTSRGEQDLLLKSQSATTALDGVIEVLYDGRRNRVQVWTFSPAQNWVQRGANIPVTFENGDQFGARTTVDGQVEVYRNGLLLATRDVSEWTFAANGGYIGLWFVNADNAVLDNFGGGTTGQTSDTTLPTVTITSPQEGERVVGTIPLAANATDNVGVSSVQFQINGVDLGAPVTATPYTVDWDTTTVANGAYQLTAIVADAAGNTATSAVVNVTVDNPGPPGSYPSTIVLDNFDRVDGGLGLNWGGATGGYSIVSNSVDVGAGNAILWNQTAFGVEQEVFVTLTNVDTSRGEQDLLLKSQSATTALDGVIEVLYDGRRNRVQVWTFSPAQNWVQRGANIPVTFENGDQFGARTTVDGQVEVYRNGLLLATRDVSEWTFAANGGYIGLWFVNADQAVLDDFGGGTVGTGATGASSGADRVADGDPAKPNFPPPAPKGQEQGDISRIYLPIVSK